MESGKLEKNKKILQHFQLHNMTFTPTIKKENKIFHEDVNSHIKELETSSKDLLGKRYFIERDKRDEEAKRLEIEKKEENMKMKRKLRVAQTVKEIKMVSNVIKALLKNDSSKTTEFLLYCKGDRKASSMKSVERPEIKKAKLEQSKMRHYMPNNTSSHLSQTKRVTHKSYTCVDTESQYNTQHDFRLPSFDFHGKGIKDICQTEPGLPEILNAEKNHNHQQRLSTDVMSQLNTTSTFKNSKAPPLITLSPHQNATPKMKKKIEIQNFASLIKNNHVLAHKSVIQLRKTVRADKLNTKPPNFIKILQIDTHEDMKNLLREENIAKKYFIYDKGIFMSDEIDYQDFFQKCKKLSIVKPINTYKFRNTLAEMMGLKVYNEENEMVLYRKVKPSDVYSTPGSSMNCFKAKNKQVMAYLDGTQLIKLRMKKKLNKLLKEHHEKDCDLADNQLKV